ncbi:MAG: flagellar basal body P-ring formation chaperone FlgA [bacterium]|nr:flagellar basal body P-ring formation chaperone FlgA [bacterium]
MKLLGFVIGAIFFAMVIFWVSIGYCLELTLKANTVVDGENIFLRDIVSLSSEEQLAEEDMDNILIGSSPLPGMSRSIGIDYINLKLKQANKKDVSLRGEKGEKGEKIAVIRSSQRLDVNNAVETARDYIVSIYNKENIKITPYSFPDEVILPKGEMTLEVDSNYSLQRLNKRLFIPIIVKINGKQLKVMRIGFEIQEFQRVVVAASDIKIKQIITANDLRVEERDINYLRQIPLANIKEAVGKRATAFIKQGSILTVPLAECPPCIKECEQVTIIKRIGNLTITASGISCEDGMIGERIGVRNSDSKKMLNGVVCEGKKVLID